MTAWPSLGVLELLVAVGEEGSVSAAARKLGVAQSNASRALTRLEHELGATLLRRTPRGTQLSADGLVMLSRARAVIDAAHWFMYDARTVADAASTVLRLGCSKTIAEYLLPRWLHGLHEIAPMLEVRPTVLNSVGIAKAVRDGIVDLGFIETPDVPHDLNHAVVADDELVVAVHPEHEWADRTRPLAIRELARTPLVAREQGSGTRLTYELALKDHDPSPPVVELEGNTAVRIAAESGLAPTILSRLAIQDAERVGTLRVVPVEGLRLRRHLCALWLKTTQLMGPRADLVSIARPAKTTPPATMV